MRIVFILVLFAFVWWLPDRAPTRFSVLEAQAQSICFQGVCVKGSAKRRRRARQRAKRRATRPSGGSVSRRTTTVVHQRWSHVVTAGKGLASNNGGLAVTYDDAGDLMLQVDVKRPIPNVAPNASIPIRVNLGRYGSFATTAIVNQTGTLLLVTGPTVVSIAEALKSGSRAEVLFLGNDFDVRLSGSRTAIEQVELAAEQWKRIRKDRVDDARKEHAKADIAERPQKKVDTLHIADDTNRGIRPAAKLRDGPRKVSDLRVQYYIPGTREIGEMWVNWNVDDKGLYLGLNFIDPDHKYDNLAHTIRMPFEKGRPACQQDIKQEPAVLTMDCRFTRALLKAKQWQKTLEGKKYRKSVSKTIDVINSKEGSDTAFSAIFKRYEDGGYAVQLDDRKFGVSKLFNFTIANALDLARITQDAVVEANQGTITEADLDDLLK